MLYEVLTEKIAKVIKAGGAVPVLQLNHAGRYSKKKISGVDPVAPSAIASRYTKELPHELTTSEVESIIRITSYNVCYMKLLRTSPQ